MPRPDAASTPAAVALNDTAPTPLSEYVHTNAVALPGPKVNGPAGAGPLFWTPSAPPLVTTRDGATPVTSPVPVFCAVTRTLTHCPATPGVSVTFTRVATNPCCAGPAPPARITFRTR